MQRGLECCAKFANIGPARFELIGIEQHHKARRGAGNHARVLARRKGCQGGTLFVNMRGMQRKGKFAFTVFKRCFFTDSAVCDIAQCTVRGKHERTQERARLPRSPSSA